MYSLKDEYRWIEKKMKEIDIWIDKKENGEEMDRLKI